MAPDPQRRPDYVRARAALEHASRRARAEAVDPYPREGTGLGSGTATERRTWPLVAALVGALVLAGVLLSLLLDTSAAPKTATAPSAKPSASAHTTPAGWQRYRGGAGWSIAVPPNWSTLNEGTRVRFTDPSGDRYLEVTTWTGSTSAIDVLRSYEPSFASSHAAYHRLGLAAVSAPAGDAADWEFTYEDGGAALHALDHAIVLHGHGFTLFFQTHADEWSGSHDLLAELFSTFRPRA